MTHCNTLQYTVTHCNTLQHITTHTATHCNTLQHTTHCIMLQHTATHCNTLQHTATHCNTLQQTATQSCLRHLCTQFTTCSLATSIYYRPCRYPIYYTISARHAYSTQESTHCNTLVAVRVAVCVAVCVAVSPHKNPLGYQRVLTPSLPLGLFFVFFVDGYCSTVQGLLDWFQVDLGFTELSFIQIDLCVLCVFVLYSRVSLSSCPFLDILHCLPRAVGVPLESALSVLTPVF